MKRAAVFIALALFGAGVAFAQAAPATGSAAQKPAPATASPDENAPAAAPGEAPGPKTAVESIDELTKVPVPPGGPTDAPLPQSPRDTLGEPVPPPAVDGELGLGWALFQTVIVLGMVIALAWLTLNVGLRKLLGIRPVSRGAPLVTVLERVPLDQKRSLFVVRVANEVLLMGGGDGALALIAKLDPAEIEKLRPETPPGQVQLSPLLTKLLGRKDAPPPPPAAPRSGEERT